MEDRRVLCGANYYDQKFYLNPVFLRLPQAIKDELKVLCVRFTHDVGGIMTLELDEDGQVQIHTRAKENDFRFDEIGSVLKAREMQREHEDLFRSLALFYQVIGKGRKISDVFGETK